ncbi:MAG: 6-phosphogluconolactonase [Candidatus Krumholzibacteria bacterium]|nr:6-phosphogluconolactonase [Candidatus Krumholzibacteria bacterium]
MAQSVIPAVRVYPDRESLSRAGAEGFVYFSNKALKHKDSFTVALSGGSTPRLLYEILASDYIDRVQWEKIHLYWCDERYVPQRDRRSNFRMFHEALLHHVHIPLGNIHPMPTHRQRAEDAALDYERYMRADFPGRWPQIDVILLGMGRDGHTASLFPQSPALGEKKRWVMAVETTASPTTRLTFTLPVLNAACDVCFLVSGKDKSQALKQVLTEPMNPQTCPASAVRPRNGQLIWWVDEDAVSEVDESELRGFEISRFDEDPNI